MTSITDITAQQDRINRLELAVRRAYDAHQSAPWDTTRKQHLKDQRELLRAAKRTLQQMMTDFQASQPRLF